MQGHEPLDGAWDTGPLELAPASRNVQHYDVLYNVSQIHDLPPTSRYQGSIARLEIYGVGDTQPRGIGTAAVLRPDLLLTAGHVIFGPIFEDDRVGYACRVHATVVTEAGTASAWGSQLIVPHDYAADPRRGHLDVGLILLTSSLVGVRTWTPAEAPDGAFSSACRLDVSGFPAGSHALRGATGVVAGLRQGMIYHRVDTEEGESGAPLCLQQQGPLLLHGVHRAGRGDSPRELWPANGAARVTAGMVGWIRTATAALPGGPTCG